jgi:hypothetical protein
MKRLVGRKSTHVNSFWRTGLPFLILLDVLLVANCAGAYQHLRELESQPIKEYIVVEKKVEVPVIKEVIKYINRRNATTRQQELNNGAL